MKVFQVSELVALVNAQLSGLGEVWVRGELSGVRVASSGHRYFTLKDAGGQLACIMWASRADRLRFKLADGLSVLLRGSLEVYAPRGSLQLSVLEVVPEGLGELQLAFEQLKAKLEAEGLFAQERKRPMPPLPQRIGLVTSAAGAAVRDVLKVLSRWPHLQVLLYPVRVQGKGAEGEIARAVRYLGRLGRLDVILVVRGGGSLEDLWAFNEEVVARAIAASPIPVISGVGHEVDFTIADFAADVRAATPTQAAELVVAQLERQARRVEDAARRLQVGWQRLWTRRQSQLALLAGARGLALFPARLRHLRASLERAQMLSQLLRGLLLRRQRTLQARLAQLMAWPVRFGAPRQRQVLAVREAMLRERLKALLVRRALELGGKLRALEALSPLGILRRGYSITTRQGDPRPLRRAEEVLAGERLVTRLAEGAVESVAVGRARLRQARLFEEGA
ncbi:MAG: exodeoxyribonuclease VII large subunit [Thermoanaerobaculum sp.]|nr:exodeoxyribonuclease VII large subunit [Thermoanaerobaculum sp.]